MSNRRKGKSQSIYPFFDEPEQPVKGLSALIDYPLYPRVKDLCYDSGC